MELGTLSALFKAVGDAARLRLLHLLCREELSVGELVQITGLPQSTVSRHIKPLREQGLLGDRPVGAATYYTAALEGEPGNGESALRDSILRQLRETPLPRDEQHRLDRVLALRREDSGEFFDRIGLRWDALRESCFGETFHLEAFLRLLPREWVVADLGAGTGYLLPLLARNFARVIGVDLSQPMLDVAARRVGEQGVKNVDLRHGRLEKLPLADGEADLAVALLMLHHMEDVATALAEIGRALKPGGRLLILELERHENERFRVAMADHRSGIEPAQMRQWLVGAGFEVDEQWPLTAARPEADHDLAPIPGVYGIIARRG